MTKPVPMSVRQLSATLCAASPSSSALFAISAQVASRPGARRVHRATGFRNGLGERDCYDHCASTGYSTSKETVLSDRVIGILGSGDMGSAVAAAFVGQGYRVVTSLAGRSGLSRKLAAAANVENLGSLDEVLANADIFLSILPPSAAIEFARDAAVRATKQGRRLIYADCNAVSPETVTAIERLFKPGPADFLDIGIVGPAPRPGTQSPTRFYVAGAVRAELLDLDVPEIAMRDMGVEIGRASAIKMTYAAMNKGTDALWTAVLMAAERLGVRAELMREFEVSQADEARRMARRIPFNAATAERFTGEMREIAATFAAAGVTDNFHRGAEWVFARLAQSSLARESRATLPAERSLDEAIGEFVKTLDSATSVPCP
jgi:3-hydroxyisobutyrate dehydrogenase-like beta-hydroxyacid dehydrogenase